MYAIFLHSDIIEGPPGIVKTFLEVGRNISRSTACNGVMATGVGTPVGVGCNMGEEEREDNGRERGRETHL